MIKLGGLVKNQNMTIQMEYIEIIYTGLRHKEKLYEELINILKPFL